MNLWQLMTNIALGAAAGIGIANMMMARKTRDIVYEQTARIVRERKIISELLGEAIFLASQANDKKGEPFTGLSIAWQRFKDIADKVDTEEGKDSE